MNIIQTPRRVFPKRTLNMAFGQVTEPPAFKAMKPRYNCLGYALHVAAWLELGDEALRSPRHMTEAAEALGLTPEKERDFDPAREHIVAGFLSMKDDFHFARLDCTRLWSHKNGPADPRYLMFDGIPCTRPEQAHIGKGYVLVGYFSVPRTMDPIIVYG